MINRILAGTAHVLRDPSVEQVLEELYARAQRVADEAREVEGAVGDFGFSVRPVQGELLYLLARAARAHTAVEFCSSEGATAVYLAAAVRDNGGGLVIGADPRPEKVAAARETLAAAGLADFVDLRCGDPVEVLADLPEPVDLVAVDGWPELAAPSLARRTLDVLAPHLRPGALVLNDGREPDYLDLVRDPSGRFRTTLLDVGVLSYVD
ncbi:class I SAM-dependent methyltransferase [Pseudonocardia xishanensis]|uniref:Class I SAM-dependent methyltransferase n=1 Tax=Pseudonocardia xishanensis TaxID=630995 RepID=A0ABP8RTQ5_9PSEU